MTEKLYVIKSDSGYYRAPDEGCTPDINCAHLYLKTEALALLRTHYKTNSSVSEADLLKLVSVTLVQVSGKDAKQEIGTAIVDAVLPGRADSDRKETNPKDQVGVKKVPMHVIPPQVVGEVGLAFLEGARKYGSYNYRAAGVRASVYYDAVGRHMAAWWEGEDIDPDSGLSHITKAISSLIVLRDGMMNEKWVDDRAPKVLDPDWIRKQNKKAAEIIERYPDCTPPFTELGSKK